MILYFAIILSVAIHCQATQASVNSVGGSRSFSQKNTSLKMSIQVENNLKKDENTEIFEQKAHYMACSIAADGPANINKYFEPYVADDNGELSASFRGYPLAGENMSLPEGYRAIVVTEAKRPLAEDAERKFQVTGGFKEFTNWNWDKKPSENDKIVAALDWIHIADALHGDDDSK